jgi:hypothetical protein
LTCCCPIYIIEGNILEVLALAQEDQSGVGTEERALDIERIKRRLDLLDQRLDNIDSMITAVAERMMRQPINFRIICPNCGKEIEIGIIGTEKPTG